MDPQEYAQQYLDGQQQLRRDAAEIAAAGLVTGAAAWLWNRRNQVRQMPQVGPGQPIEYIRADEAPRGRPLLGFGAIIAIALVIAYVVFFIQSF